MAPHPPCSSSVSSGWWWPGPQLCAVQPCSYWTQHQGIHPAPPQQPWRAQSCGEAVHWGWMSNWCHTNIIQISVVSIITNKQYIYTHPHTYICVYMAMCKSQTLYLLCLNKSGQFGTFKKKCIYCQIYLNFHEVYYLHNFSHRFL